MGATQLGDHRFDGQLDEINRGARKQEREFATRYLEELKELEWETLSTANQVDAELLRNRLEYELWSPGGTSRVGMESVALHWSFRWCYLWTSRQKTFAPPGGSIRERGVSLRTNATFSEASAEKPSSLSWFQKYTRKRL